MTANIAFTANNFAAVAADTRVGFKVGETRYLIDTYNDAVACGLADHYPQNFVKICSAGLNWYAISGDGKSGWPLLQLVTQDPLASFEKAKDLVEKKKSSLTTPSTVGTTISQLEKTFVMCAPYRTVNIGAWMIGLEPNDQRTDDYLDTPIGWGCDPEPTDNESLQAVKQLKALAKQPTPYNVAQSMARIIQLAEKHSDTVGPMMDFGVTYKTPSGKIITQAYRGSTQDVVVFSEAEFMSHLAPIP